MVATLKSKEDLKSALPDTSKTLSLKGLNATIEIYRDNYGIPHVKAQSVHDAFFGQGFASAQDRLWHMDYDRRRAYGRWAEYAGPSAAAQDEMMRRFQIGPTVKIDYEAINAETRAMLDAYAEGVNAFIENTNSPPIEYSLVRGQPEPWQPWDCLAVFKVRHIFMGVFESKLWRARLVNKLGPEKAARLLRGYQPGHLLIIPPGVNYDGPILDGLKELSKGAEAINWLNETEAGSNNWVLSGSRTASGKPLLAGDPHRALDTPNVYYQNHISCPEFDVIGLSFPGCPGFAHFGHNAHVAWCVTHAGADYQDLYVERFKKDDPTLYEFKGQWKQAEVHHETIKVCDGQPVELDVTVTHHGPVIAGDPAKGYGIAFRYTATAEPNTGFESLLEMLKARSIDELDESMRPWVDPCNNFLYADIYGNIGYLNRGKVPIRSMANAWLPVPGWTGEHEWRGFIPFEKLARSRNPDTSCIVTANNRIVGKDYPYYISLDSTPEFRARRITDRLQKINKATVQDMAAVHAEKVSIPGRTYAQLLSQIEPQDEFSARVKTKLIGWDGTMERDAVAPTIYRAFRDKLNRSIIEPLLESLAHEAFGTTNRGIQSHTTQMAALFVRMARENDPSLLPTGSDWKSLLSRALAEGVAYLRERLGDDIDSWQWGKVHFTKPQHTLSASFPELASLLDPPSVPMGGDGDTPQAGSYSSSTPFVMTGMSVARYVFDTSDWNNSAWIIPLGTSGHPGSSHYADQAPIWGEVKLIPMLFDWKRIA
ncbi:MAG: penicillin acylase family protein, partial [Candidatus Tectomicrobia bacterium]|nr:penicillin acylase family protein [Candidatus Tectomicrobia bacterium]